MINNKQLGNQTEKMFLNYVKENRGWACLIPSSLLGQPLDIVGIVHGIPIYVDIKHCSRDVFMFSDIQTNQKLSMQKICEAFEDSYAYAKVGLMIYFEVIKDWRFYPYQALETDLAYKRKGVSVTDTRLERLDV